MKQYTLDHTGIMFAGGQSHKRCAFIAHHVPKMKVFTPQRYFVGIYQQQCSTDDLGLLQPLISRLMNRTFKVCPFPLALDGNMPALNTLLTGAHKRVLRCIVPCTVTLGMNFPFIMVLDSLI